MTTPTANAHPVEGGLEDPLRKTRTTEIYTQDTLAQLLEIFRSSANAYETGLRPSQCSPW